jgi:hypothetical protein
MCEDFAPNFGDKDWLLHHDNAHSYASFFTMNFFTKINIIVVLHPTLLFSVFPIEHKLRNCRFDTIEVIGTESQAVLNTFTKHDFQDALKNGRSSGNGAYARKGTISKVMVASKPKVSF